MGETKNLSDKEALIKLKDLVEDIKTCVFATNLEYLPINARPIYTKQVDDDGDIWFLLTKTGEHYNDIQQDNRVQLFYSHPGKSEFLSVYGSAAIVDDPKKLKEIWSKLDEAWFKSPDDPDIAMVKVKVNEAYYWDTKHNRITSILKIVSSAFSNKSKDDGIKGKLNV